MREPPRRQRNAIAFCLNDRFVPPACALLESIARHGCVSADTRLVAIASSLTDESARELAECAQSVQLPLDIRFIADTTGLGAIADSALSTCLRLYLGEICHDFARVLYLDCDMLVLSSLAPLLQFDLQARTAAATINHPPFSIMRVAIPKARRAGVPEDGSYFNAGVILFDVERWNARDTGKRARAYLSAFPNTRLLDQDALNIALAGDWLPLDMEWNSPAGPLDTAPMLRGMSLIDPSLMATLELWKRAQAGARILHFTGQPKPWEPDYSWRELSDQYAQYMRPEFAARWPSSQQPVPAENQREQRPREFRRM
jgi:lipopolysaccharide biosynthesis glycosyltransferase